ncbi:MAG: hypothetical protein AAGA54_08570, partial [Myxococcota bacterium]
MLRTPGLCTLTALLLLAGCGDDAPGVEGTDGSTTMPTSSTGATMTSGAASSSGADSSTGEAEDLDLFPGLSAP